MKVKEESEKVGLKLNIQKTEIMASGPITSWEIDGETVTDFIFLGSKITADGDSVQFTSVAQSCLTPCDSMNCSTPGLPVPHQLPQLTQTHVHRVGDASNCHSFSSKEQASFNFIAAVTICCDFGAQENKVCLCSHCQGKIRLSVAYPEFLIILMT